MRVLSRIARLVVAAVGLLSATSSLAPAQAGTWDLSLVLAPTLPSRVDLLATQALVISSTMVVTYSGTGLAELRGAVPAEREWRVERERLQRAPRGDRARDAHLLQHHARTRR